ncbi:hypothetical protein SAY86_023648 [Trapa natans]|uniref:Uncharacterized protein n=1 Tax=Trapa natans TaxID=22666 RepID=A0AAN7LQA4_TRANT|nr:hypothetical protein SAY86_023648 [Trapa natans]
MFSSWACGCILINGQLWVNRVLAPPILIPFENLPSHGIIVISFYTCHVLIRQCPLGIRCTTIFIRFYEILLVEREKTPAFASLPLYRYRDSIMDIAMRTVLMN